MKTTAVINHSPGMVSVEVGDRQQTEKNILLIKGSKIYKNLVSLLGSERATYIMKEIEKRD